MKLVFFSIILFFNAPLYGSIYLDLHGNYERVSLSSTSWNGYGAGAGIGFSVSSDTFLEVYADGLIHKNPNADLSFLSNTDRNLFYTVHYGGKLVFLLSDFFIIKAGCGIAAYIFKYNVNTYIENNFEALVSAGFNLPIAPITSFSVELIYRRTFKEADDLNYLGLQIGLLFKI